MKIHTVMPAVALAAALSLTACSATEPAPSPTTSSVPDASSQGAASNEADVSFVQQMYPHHAQATEMAQMVDGRTDNPDVLELAEQIAKGQGPEMDQMASMLDSFGEPVPSRSATAMGASGMEGMMGSTDMTSLEQASGAAFDQMWLSMMVEHHSGAIEMARVELRDGSNLEARQLATAITAAQEEEITTMQALLARG